jgi:hypothetical protein
VEETERILRDRWGLADEDRLDGASAAWEPLPAAIRVDLTHTRVRWAPAFCEFMAQFGERLLDPRTEQGMARRLAPYREESG